MAEDEAEAPSIETGDPTPTPTPRIGLIASAGEMATAWGLTGWPTGTARDAALEVLGLWLEGRGGGGAAEARDAVARGRAFLTAHGASRFESVHDDGLHEPEPSRAVINRAGWRAPGLFYISTDAWKEIHAGADPARAARHVVEAGFIEPGDGRNIAARVPGETGRPRAYAVKVEILGGGDD
ncbi:MAG: hypothetical protein R6V44_00560 [Paracoccaceae bacterium]